MDIGTLYHNFYNINTYTLTALTFACICAYYYNKRTFEFWKRRGVKGPDPSPFVGNAIPLLFNNPIKRSLEWIREYGRVFGFYQGSKPILMISDPDVLRQICVKDFDVFTGHGFSNEFQSILQRSFIFNLHGEHWKRVRALLSPTFTSGKIKRMFKLLDTCANDLVQCFHEKASLKETSGGTVVNAKDIYNLYTMDGITTCCYGLKLEREGSSDIQTAATRNDFVNRALTIFNFNALRFASLMLVPKWILRLIEFETISAKVIEPLSLKVTKLIEIRRSSSKKHDDYLQLLLDAKIDDELELNDMDNAENHHAGLTHEGLISDQRKLVQEVKSVSSGQAKLSEVEILASAVFLMAVGLETTGNLLTNCTYALSFHPEIQEKLYEELKKIAKLDELTKRYVFDYDALTSCDYLDSTLSETLRMIPPLLSTTRLANEDYHIEKNDINVPKGTEIVLDFFGVHNNPDFWDKPEIFNPERFMPHNKDKIVPGTYMPFGIGPRHCIGMRFSLTEAKLGLAKVIMNFRIDRAEGTVWPPEPASYIGINKIKNPFVNIVPRPCILNN